MAPSLQAIIVVLAACCMVVIVSSSAELAEPPSPSITAAATASLHRSGQLYTMDISVGGTEAVSCVADTGSDLIWMRNSQFDSSVSCPSEEKCKCITCCRPEDGKEMDMNCGYGLTTFERKYGDNLPVRGVVGEAKLTTFVHGKPTYTTPSALYIGSAVMCGCHLSSAATQDSMPCKAYKRGGIVGLDRGEMSLVRQLRLHRFSYCLPYASSQAPGLLNLNDAAAPSKDSRETGLVRVEELPYPSSSRYYVRLKEIAIGSTGTTVSLHNGCFDKDLASGNGGMVIDLGTVFSKLPKDVKSRVEKEVEKLMETEPGKEPERVKHDKFSCYKGTYPKDLGNIELRFCDGSAMEIPAENYFYADEVSFCLAFEQTYGDKDQMAILGAYQQRGMHMLFDIEGNTLSFAKHSGTCGQPQEENHATM